MRGMAAWTVAAVVLTFATSSSAQTTAERRGSVGAVLGAGQTWDDEGSIGSGAVAGARVEWRLFGRTSVEGAFDVLRHERSTGAFRAEGTSRIFSGSLVQRFGSRRVQPYMLGGVHLVDHSGSTTFDDRRTDRSSSDMGLHFGGGLAFAVTDRIAIGPEARFFIVRANDDSAPAWADWVGVRLSIGFP